MGSLWEKGWVVPRPPTTYSGKRETATVGKDEKMTPCPHCGRKFAESRLGKHINVCQKTSAKKERKVFDPSKQRLAETGAMLWDVGTAKR